MRPIRPIVITAIAGMLLGQPARAADQPSSGSFSANGYDGQYTVCVPDLDMVLVRHGATPLDRKDALKAWIGAVIDCWGWTET